MADGGWQIVAIPASAFCHPFYLTFFSFISTVGIG
jgi:hypothetical protein